MPRRHRARDALGGQSTNAREYQKRAIIARRRNQEARRASLEAEIVRMGQAAIEAAQVAGATPPDVWTTRLIARVRVQIERIMTLWGQTDDPKALDQYASAFDRLTDRERILRGAPLPGSRRPAPEKVGKPSLMED